jgi:hypothetical protein
MVQEERNAERSIKDGLTSGNYDEDRKSHWA